MAAPATALAALMSMWGHAQSAYRDPTLRAAPGGVTQYLWEAWKQSYLARGEQPPKVTIQDMNRLVSQAGQQWRSEQRLNASINVFRTTGLDQAITAEHVTPDVDSRSPSQQPLGPNYRIRFDATYLIEGVAQELTFTWEPGIQAPTSVGDLLDGLTEAGEGFAEDYGTDFVGLGGNISITSF